MKLILKDNVGNYTHKDLEADIALLPSWRREQALKYRLFNGKRDCTLSYLLLCQALKEEYGITDKPTFVISEHGKPSLLEFPEIHFNLSHCNNAIACAISSSPIGIDVETLERKISGSLIKHTMNEEEQEEIRKDPDKFFRFWTQKEALVKLHGTGLQDNLHNLLSKENIKNIDLHTEIHKAEAYALSIATLKH
jgi:4'-phosphopantetheinyl transferase